MQNPVASSAWLTADMQLLLPLVTLTVNTKSCCEPLWRSRPVLVIAVIYVLLALIAAMVRPLPGINLLRLYNFPQSFRWQYTGIVMGSILAYAVWMGITRILLMRRQQCKVHPQSGDVQLG